MLFSPESHESVQPWEYHTVQSGQDRACIQPRTGEKASLLYVLVLSIPSWSIKPRKNEIMNYFFLENKVVPSSTTEPKQLHNPKYWSDYWWLLEMIYFNIVYHIPQNALYTIKAKKDNKPDWK